MKIRWNSVSDVYSFISTAQYRTSFNQNIIILWIICSTGEELIRFLFLKNEFNFLSQLFEQTTSTYTYIVVDGKTRDALIIDPVITTVARDMQLLKQLDLRLRYARTLMIDEEYLMRIFPCLS